MDWAGDLYGDVVRVRFLHRLRDERKFNSIEELTSQIQKDVQQAQNYFSRQPVKCSLAMV
jgi:riboflavin kinase/FMN adenylyltransferase